MVYVRDRGRVGDPPVRQLLGMKWQVGIWKLSKVISFSFHENRPQYDPQLTVVPPRVSKGLKDSASRRAAGAGELYQAAYI